jgi:hypothetical protein
MGTMKKTDTLKMDSSTTEETKIDLGKAQEAGIKEDLVLTNPEMAAPISISDGEESTADTREDTISNDVPDDKVTADDKGSNPEEITSDTEMIVNPAAASPPESVAQSDGNGPDSVDKEPITAGGVEDDNNADGKCTKL